MIIVISCKITGKHQNGRCSPSKDTKNSPPPVSLLILPIITASIKITEANTTPFNPLPKPSTTWSKDIPLIKAIMAESKSAAPKAQLILGVPSITKLPTAMAVKVTKGKINSSTCGL